MKNNYVWILLLLSTFLLGSCSIEEIEIDGVNYLTYKVDGEYYARKTIDSMYNYEVSEWFN